MMIRLDKKHQLPATLQKVSLKPTVTVIPAYVDFIFVAANGQAYKKRPATSPPFSVPIPLFITNCVYRI